MRITDTNIGEKYPTEEMLLEEIRQGNHQAFWELWLCNQEYLYNFCLKLMNYNFADTQEIMSSSMLRAWKRMPEHAFKITNFRAWITRITYNLCMDIHRQKAYNFSIDENLESMRIEDEGLLSGTIDSPEATIMRRELIMVIYRLIENLPESLRTPVVLRFIQEKNYREIAEIVNISEDNVRKRIQQGRILLKRSILKYLAGAKHFSPLVKVGDEESDFFLTSWQFEQLVKVNTDLPKMRGQDLEALIYRLSVTHPEILPHRYYSLH